MFYRVECEFYNIKETYLRNLIKNTYEIWNFVKGLYSKFMWMEL
jgi:hypothetical protein